MSQANAMLLDTAQANTSVKKVSFGFEHNTFRHLKYLDTLDASRFMRRNSASDAGMYSCLHAAVCLPEVMMPVSSEFFMWDMLPSPMVFLSYQEILDFHQQTVAELNGG